MFELILWSIPKKIFIGFYVQSTNESNKNKMPFFIDIPAFCAALGIGFLGYAGAKKVASTLPSDEEMMLMQDVMQKLLTPPPPRH